MFRIFESHKLEMFRFIRFRFDLTADENNFRTSLMKTNYEINMCKSQYKKDLEKTLRVNEGLILGG